MTDLKQWIVQHLKYRDLLKKEIIEIIPDPEKKWDFIVKKQSGIQHIKITPSFAIPQEPAENTILVTENTENNIQTLLKEWDQFITIPTLQIYFVGPQENYWIINPYTHNKITEKASLVQGIKSMYETSLQ